jgi:hypothetical protein
MAQDANRSAGSPARSIAGMSPPLPLTQSTSTSSSKRPLTRYNYSAIASALQQSARHGLAFCRVAGQCRLCLALLAFPRRLGLNALRPHPRFRRLRLLAPQIALLSGNLRQQVVRQLDPLRPKTLLDAQ